MPVVMRLLEPHVTIKFVTDRQKAVLIRHVFWRWGIDRAPGVIARCTALAFADYASALLYQLLLVHFDIFDSHHVRASPNGD